MAMSTRCFCAVMIVVVLGLAGAVAAVVIFMNNNNDSSLTKEVNSDATKKMNDQTGTNSVASPESTKTTRTPEECLEWSQNSNQPLQSTTRFGRNPIATRETILARTGEKIVRNAYWLTGNSVKDTETLENILMQACLGKIPVVVVKMRPSKGLHIGQSTSWNYYKPSSLINTWKEYDAKLSKILRRLSKISAIVVLEPDLLMFTFDLDNQQYRWINEKYEEEFLKRAQRVIKQLPKARVYVDVGNAAYLGQSLSYLDQTATTLLRLTGLRGFAINTMHFVNQTYNELIARKLWCRTGLHYIVDTSRNGGKFSKQAIRDIEKCLFDPPNVKKGLFPGWSWGSQSQIRKPRLKRWIHQIGSSSSNILSGSPVPPTSVSNKPRSVLTGSPFQTTKRNNNDRNDQNWEVNNYNNQINNQKNNMNNNNQRPFVPKPRSTIPSHPSIPTSKSASNVLSIDEAQDYLRFFKSKLRSCASKKSITSAHDANVWIKAPGESDGRLYTYGTYHSCLLGHTVPCSDACQAFVQVNSRSTSCYCDNRPSRKPPSSEIKYNSFPIDNFS